MENQSINLTSISEDRLKNLEANIQEIKEAIFNSKKEEINSQWIDSTKIPKLLNVSLKTWQNYRDKKVIPFSQFGRKIYVRRSDLEAFMQKNLIQ